MPSAASAAPSRSPRSNSSRSKLDDTWISIDGVAVGTVKSRANRGRRKLAELMHMAEGEELDMTDASTLAVMAVNQPVSR